MILYHKEKFSLLRTALSSTFKTLEKNAKDQNEVNKKDGWSTEGWVFDLILPALKLFGKKRELEGSLQRASMTKD